MIDSESQKNSKKIIFYEILSKNTFKFFQIKFSKFWKLGKPNLT